VPRIIQRRSGVDLKRDQAQTLDFTNSALALNMGADHGLLPFLKWIRDKALLTQREVLLDVHDRHFERPSDHPEESPGAFRARCGIGRRL
jgi:hypothetical protein